MNYVLAAEAVFITVINTVDAFYFSFGHGSLRFFLLSFAPKAFVWWSQLFFLNRSTRREIGNRPLILSGSSTAAVIIIAASQLGANHFHHQIIALHSV